MTLVTIAMNHIKARDISWIQDSNSARLMLQISTSLSFWVAEAKHTPFSMQCLLNFGQFTCHDLGHLSAVLVIFIMFT